MPARVYSNIMSFTYDLDTNIGLIRLIINDKYSADPIFADEELTAFFVIESSVVKRGAAAALEAIARDEVLVQKVVKTLQLSTDGAKVSAELRAHAALLRAQAASEAETDDDTAPFEIAEWINSTFAGDELYIKTALRTTEGL